MIQCKGRHSEVVGIGWASSIMTGWMIGVCPHEIAVSFSLKGFSVLVYPIELYSSLRFRCCLVLVISSPLEPLSFPSLPASLDQILRHDQVPQPQLPCHLQFEQRVHNPHPPEPSREDEPDHGTDHPGPTTDQDLLGRMITQIDPTDRHGRRAAEPEDRQSHSSTPREGYMLRGMGWSRLVPQEEEQGQSDGEERDELGVRRRHTITLVQHACGFFAINGVPVRFPSFNDNRHTTYV